MQEAPDWPKNAAQQATTGKPAYWVYAQYPNSPPTAELPVQHASRSIFRLWPRGSRLHCSMASGQKIKINAKSTSIIAELGAHLVWRLTTANFIIVQQTLVLPDSAVVRGRCRGMRPWRHLQHSLYSVHVLYVCSMLRVPARRTWPMYIHTYLGSCAQPNIEDGTGNIQRNRVTDAAGGTSQDQRPTV